MGRGTWRGAAWAVALVLAGCGPGDDIRRTDTSDSGDTASCVDTDADGRCAADDLCVGNDQTGDEDGDGVCDDLDICSDGRDDDDVDADGVPGACDDCAGTPSGTLVDDRGCPVSDTDDTDDTGVANQDPTLADLGLTGDPGLFNDATLTCTGTLADADGNITSTTYTFTNVTRSAVIATGGSNQVLLDPSDHEPGDTVRCEIRVTDNDGATASDTVDVQLVDRAPVITAPAITPTTPGGVFNDSELSCAASVVDPDGATPVVTFGWDNATTAAALGGGALTMLTPSDASPGDEVRCRITADAGLSTEVTDTVSETVANRLPVVFDVEIAEPLYNDSVAMCDFTAQDPDGQDIASVSVQWRDAQGTSLGVGGDLDLSSKGLSRGAEVVCVVSANDGIGQGAEASDSAFLGNRAPVAVGVFLNPDGARYGEVVTCQASFLDPDGDPIEADDVSFSWVNVSTGETLPATGDTLVMTGKYVSATDVLRCVATASDGVAQGSGEAEVDLDKPAPGHRQEQGDLGVVAWVPSGSFTQGCVKGRDDAFEDCDPDERPAREVALTHGLWMMEKELTSGMLAALGIDEASVDLACGADCPTEGMSWSEAALIANAASAAMGLTPCYDESGTAIADPDAGDDVQGCEGWRLPTEAEWERAARADEGFAYATDVNDPGAAGWSSDTSGAAKQTACTGSINRWGLCDLSGNVWEWAHDRLAIYTPAPDEGPILDPVADDGVSPHVHRGGAWDTPVADLRIASRAANPAGAGTGSIGVRFVRTVRPSEDTPAPSTPEPALEDDMAGGLVCIGFDNAIPGITYRMVLFIDGRPTQFSSQGDEGQYLEVPDQFVQPGDVWTCRQYAEDGVGGVTWAQTAYEVPFQEGDSREGAAGPMRYIPSGSLTMGCVEGRDDPSVACILDETPAREVIVGHGFWMTESEVTQGIWADFFGTDPSGFGDGSAEPCGEDCPVERVTWYEALALANAASAAEGLPSCYDLAECSGSVGFDFSCALVSITSASGDPQDCEGYRLPTEAEWEHAARGRTSEAYVGGDFRDAHAWYDTIAPEPVCSKDTNWWGLCDMAGNVAEWTADAGSTLDPGYPPGEFVDPWQSAGDARWVRGGSYASTLQGIRPAARELQGPGTRSPEIGVRLVRTVFVDPEDQPPTSPTASVLDLGANGLECSAASEPTDPDGGTVQVRVVWRKNGVPTKYQGQSPGDGPIVTVPAFDLIPGQVWTCDVSASDGKNPPRIDSGTIFVDGVPGTDDRLETAALGVAPWVPAGDFTMGCFAERDGVSDPATCGPGEDPPQEVRIGHGLWAMEAEVKQSWWNDLMPDAPVASDCDNCPVTGMSWFAALQFANRASEAMGLDACYILQGCTDGVLSNCSAADPNGIAPWDCDGWRLPTEAEWEYMARGGLHNTALTSPGNVADIAWYGANSGDQTNAACSTVDPFNDFALCDMAGNAAEWVWDAYADRYPGGGPNPDPTGPFQVGGLRVVRGGGFLSNAADLRNAARSTLHATAASPTVGLRLVRTAYGPPGNQRPSTTGLSLDVEQNGPVAGDITCDAGPVPSDPDGDPVLMRTVLYRDGEPTRFQENRASGSTSLFVDTALTRSGEVWTCRLVIHDGLGQPQVLSQSDIVP